MHAEKANCPVKMTARLLEAGRSGSCGWEKRGGPADGWAAARDAVARAWLESDGRFGFRLVRAVLPEEFSHPAPYRVRKPMRKLGIRGCTPNASKGTTVRDPRAKDKRDLAGRDLGSPVPTYGLVGDITYLRTGEGWLCLATVIDLCTRVVVGWSMSSRTTADIAVNALENARVRGYVAENAIFHSDKGSQYTSRALPGWADEHQVRLSCSRTGSCRDNAVAESFFATLKNEMYYRSTFKTRAEAKRAVMGFIEGYYNRRRPHSSIGYRIPAEAMESFFERTAPKPEGLPMTA